MSNALSKNSCCQNRYGMRIISFGGLTIAVLAYILIFPSRPAVASKQLQNTGPLTWLAGKLPDHPVRDSDKSLAGRYLDAQQRVLPRTFLHISTMTGALAFDAVLLHVDSILAGVPFFVYGFWAAADTTFDWAYLQRLRMEKEDINYRKMSLFKIGIRRPSISDVQNYSLIRGLGTGFRIISVSKAISILGSHVANVSYLNAILAVVEQYPEAIGQILPVMLAVGLVVPASLITHGKGHYTLGEYLHDSALRIDGPLVRRFGPPIRAVQDSIERTRNRWNRPRR